MRPSRRLSLLLGALGAPRAARAQTIAITGGKVYPVSGPPIEGGTVLMRDGKIVAVGSASRFPPARSASTRRARSSPPASSTRRRSSG